MANPARLQAEVAEVVEHASDLRSYLLRPLRRCPRFLPGQFLQLALDPYDPSRHWPESRPFSIANWPAAGEALRISVSRKGRFTGRMFDELRPGALVWLKLPYGAFAPAPRPDGACVLLAGGTGVTPFVAFLEAGPGARAGAAAEGEVQLHYGARTPALLVYREAVEACRARWPHLGLSLYVDDFAGTPDPAVRLGRIDVGEIWAGLVRPEAAVFYLAGPAAMIDAQRAALLGLGAAPTALVTDEWS